MTSDYVVDQIDVSCYTIPTSSPEADGTLEWDSTTMVVVEMRSADVMGLGWTYGHKATALLARDLAEKYIRGESALDLPRLHARMLRQVRNDGWQGVAAMAVSALDIALWDLKAKLLEVPLAQMFGQAASSVMVYGSGGFTTYTDEQLKEQLGGWVAQGIRAVKIKVGANAGVERHRISVVRDAVGDAELFIDANGACSSAQEALRLAEIAGECGVGWFEEPVSSDRLDELRWMRERAPVGMEIAAGEYGYDPYYFERMLQAKAVDVLQIDATRCHGFTGFLNAAAIASGFGVPLSAHCAPALHMHVAGAVSGFRHIEYFHDHARIESLLLEGCIAPKHGCLAPDLSRAGMGYVFKRKDAEQFAVRV